MTTTMTATPTTVRIRRAVRSVVDLYATPLTASHYVELVNPLWATHRLQARVVDVWDETSDARTLTLQPGRNWRAHRAGQHVRIGLSIDGRHYTRTYSISSPPSRQDGLITITVKMIDGGRLSPHLVRSVKVGDHLPIGLPQGDFVRPWGRPVRPLYITAGSGITPVMSMLRNDVEEEFLPDTTHVHYAPHAYDVVFGQELQRIAADHPRSYRYHPVYTRELGAETSHERHFSRAQLEELCPDWRERETWACGPQGLLDALEATWAEAGIAERLHTERFRAALAPLPADVTGGDVTFALPDRTVTATADGTTPLLRVAEEEGLNPPHGCRMGICRTCDVPLTEGRVRDLRTGETVEVGPQDAPRTVQTCVTAAAGRCSLALPRPAD